MGVTRFPKLSLQLLICAFVSKISVLVYFNVHIFLRTSLCETALYVGYQSLKKTKTDKNYRGRLWKTKTKQTYLSDHWKIKKFQYWVKIIEETLSFNQRDPKPLFWLVSCVAVFWSTFCEKDYLPKNLCGIFTKAKSVNIRMFMKLLSNAQETLSTQKREFLFNSIVKLTYIQLVSKVYANFSVLCRFSSVLFVQKHLVTHNQKLKGFLTAIFDLWSLLIEFLNFLPNATTDS